jgi:hypothetical protein
MLKGHLRENYGCRVAGDLYVCIYVCVCCVCTCVSMYVCEYVCVYVCIYVCTYVSMYVCMNVCKRMQPASMHGYVCVCVCSVHISVKYPDRIPARVPDVPIVFPCLALVSPSNDRTAGTAHHTLAAHGRQCIVFYSSPLDKITSCNIKLYICDVLWYCCIKGKAA